MHAHGNNECTYVYAHSQKYPAAWMNLGIAQVVLGKFKVYLYCNTYKVQGSWWIGHYIFLYDPKGSRRELQKGNQAEGEVS